MLIQLAVNDAMMKPWNVTGQVDMCLLLSHVQYWYDLCMIQRHKSAVVPVIVACSNIYGVTYADIQVQLQLLLDPQGILEAPMTTI